MTCITATCRAWATGALLALVSLPWMTSATTADQADAPKTREFLFTYSSTVAGLKPRQQARIWLPVPQSTEDQEVKIADEKLPAKGTLGHESKYGNRILYLQAAADAKGEIPLSITYRVKRQEVIGAQRRNKLSASDAKLFLAPDKLVPLGGKPQELVKGRKLPAESMALAKTFYDVVNEHMTYSKQGDGWGRGDAEWACDSKFGNCTDFHSLFISLARTVRIPAKFEMGFPISEQRGRGEIGGYHCWALFSPDHKHWVPVDISEANRAKEKNPKMVGYFFGNLTEDRVTFTVGRDLDLVPRQDGPALNYFIYPYVEVNGQPYPAENIRRSFAYTDVKLERRTP